MRFVQLTNKSLVTTMLAIVVIVAGYLIPVYRTQVLSVGFFALSGAITNWLAIHMLFEKVPFLYGSGVIPERFEEFKIEIKTLIMNQFFTEENLNQFFEAEKEAILGGMDFASVVNALDYDEAFRALSDVVLQSSLGSVLILIGGENALEPAREPVKSVMQSVIVDVARSESFRQSLERNLLPAQMGPEVRGSVEEIIDQRLNELTPQMVKEIVQDIIREHLGWLVVWGGVFGGLIGLVMSFVGF